jgi:hypothetical protein
MRTREEWAAAQLGPRSALVLGWRTNRRLHARRLRLAADMDAQLRSRAQAMLATIASREPRTYEASAHLEDEEVFLLEVSSLPTRPPSKRRKRAEDEDGGIGDQQAQVSALVALLSSPGDLDPLDADDAAGQSFLFYAVVFSDSATDDPIAFIKRHNSASVLGKGWLLGLWVQTVTHVDNPVLVFAQDFDLVIDGEEIASLRPDAIQRLFADIDIVPSAAPALVRQLGEHRGLRLTDEAQQAIVAACGRRRDLARRLQTLLAQAPRIWGDPGRAPSNCRRSADRRYLSCGGICGRGRHPRSWIRTSGLACQAGDPFTLLGARARKDFAGYNVEEYGEGLIQQPS